MNLLKSPYNTKLIEIQSLHVVQTNASRMGLPLQEKLTYCVHMVLSRKKLNSKSFLTCDSLTLSPTKLKQNLCDATRSILQQKAVSFFLSSWDFKIVLKLF